MRVPINWLKDYVDVALLPAELAGKLTMAGFEAEDVTATGEGWDNIVVGQIVAVNLHPNADRLRLATVDLGTEQETVVCGAPNVNKGDMIAFARVGARLINPYNGEVEELKTAKIRGVSSRGMICSEKELGISDNHEGILVLAETAAKGTPLADYMGDTVLDLYEVKEPGDPGPGDYGRRVVEWWPRKGMDTVDVAPAMPLRTWTLREREWDPAAVGEHLILGIEALNRRVLWGRPRQFKAHLVGFRGLGNRHGNPFEPGSYYCPAVVLRLEDGTLRCFTRGMLVEADEKFILDLYLKEMDRLRE